MFDSFEDSIPRYWGSAINPANGTLLWRSSAQSVTEAREKADQAALHVTSPNKKSWGQAFNFDNTNVYPKAPAPREKLLDEFKDPFGKTCAFLTRNLTGAQVINCRNVLFLDWDLTFPQPPLFGCLLAPFRSFLHLFHRDRDHNRDHNRNHNHNHNHEKNSSFNDSQNSFLSPGNPQDQTSSFPANLSGEQTPEDYSFLLKQYLFTNFKSRSDQVIATQCSQIRPIDTLAKLVDYIKEHPDWSVRIYQTAGGYRGIVTHAPFTPDEEVFKLMTDFGCDRRYIQFCRFQHCFRARLTPKGWRCGFQYAKIAKGFRFRYPWLPEDAISAENYEKGVQLYEKKAERFAVCRYLGTLGKIKIHSAIQPILDLHDQWTLLPKKDQNKNLMGSESRCESEKSSFANRLFVLG